MTQFKTGSDTFVKPFNNVTVVIFPLILTRKVLKFRAVPLFHVIKKYKKETFIFSPEKKC